jgi:peptidoglycan/LPS O-acetylase OafA/YrhL
MSELRWAASVRAGTAPTRASRRADVQGLRALAVVLVVTFHARAGLTGGFVGVDVFFVISGYVIVRMLLTERGASGATDLRRFYLRRVRRILPALALTLVVVTALSPLLAPIGGREVTVRTGAAAALVSANTYLISRGGSGYFGVSAESNALLHTWSLSIEEQFYLVLPTVLVGAWWIGRRRNWSTLKVAAWVLCLLGVASFALSWALSTGHTGPVAFDRAGIVAYYAAPTRAWEFVAGALAAVASALIARASQPLRHAFAVVGMGAVLAASLLFDGFTQYPGTAALLPVGGTLLLIAAGEGGRHVLSPLLEARPALLLGDASYSWYLWHWPVIVFAAALVPGDRLVAIVAGAVSFVPAWLSYRYVEEPVRRGPMKPVRRTAALAAVCVLVPVAVALPAGRLDLGRSSFDRSFALHADHTNGCDTGWRLRAGVPDGCSWPATAGGGTAVLAGDSNAGQFTEAFAAGANEAGLDAVVLTRPLCPVVDVVVVHNGAPDVDCAHHIGALLDDLVAEQPDIVVLASASDAYIEFDEFGLQTPGAAEVAVTPTDKSESWRRGLARVIERLAAADIPTIVVLPIPKFPGWDPAECATIRWVVEPASCGETVERAAAERHRARAVDAETTAAQVLDQTVLDPFATLCPDPARCATHDGSGWLWRDGSHLSVRGAERLSPLFSESLRGAAARSGP